jgi:hypothetical protein
VHILFVVRGDEAEIHLSELRRRARAAPDPTCREIGEIPGLGDANLQAERLRTAE